MVLLETFPYRRILKRKNIKSNTQIKGKTQQVRPIQKRHIEILEITSCHDTLQIPINSGLGG